MRKTSQTAIKNIDISDEKRNFHAHSGFLKELVTVRREDDDLVL